MNKKSIFKTCVNVKFKRDQKRTVQLNSRCSDSVEHEDVDLDQDLDQDSLVGPTPDVTGHLVEE